MDSKASKDVFPLLDLPAEIRDMIYEHILFGPAYITDMDQRGANLHDGTQIHTNILLTSRQIFQEAQNAILRAQLVHITTHGIMLEDLWQDAALVGGIPLFHARFKRLCLLKHIMDEDYLSESWHEQDDISYLVRSKDVHQLFHAHDYPGTKPYATQALNKNIDHNLVLVDPQARLPPSPAYVSMTVPTIDRLMRIYQKALGGCQNVWMSAHTSSPGEPGWQFMENMVKKIKSGNINSSGS